jgi:hypothetical protein
VGAVEARLPEYAGGNPSDCFENGNAILLCESFLTLLNE